jgi:DNA primase
LPKEFLPLSTREMAFSSLPARKYLKDRRITNSDILKWKIGYCVSGPYKGRVIIPSFDSDGKANFFVARNCINSWKKYMNPSVCKNDIIFNELYLDFSKEIVIVEGVFDSIVAGDNSVPLLGSTLSEESKLFWEIIKNDTTIYIALDRDAEKKSLSIIKKLLKYDIEVFKIDTGDYEDVALMPRDVFEERKNKAEFMSMEKYMICKAMMA